jgi:hypothetical protein
MASTRNKNTPGNYSLEQNQHRRFYEEVMYRNSSTGAAYQLYFPGDGLLMGKMKSRDLASNSTDIESTLFGIGSTNLESPLPTITPDIHTFKNLNMIHKTPMILPAPFMYDTNNRPMYLN